MGIEDKLHQQMVKIVLGGVVKIDSAPEKSFLGELKRAFQPQFKRIKAFFAAGLNEMKRDMQKKQKSSKSD